MLSWTSLLSSLKKTNWGSGVGERTNALIADVSILNVLLHHFLLEVEGKGFNWRRGLQDRSTPGG